ncbi:MAG: hypothetical protein HXY41_00470 [Chloroflexi bacterium]|nr:hypothetical protein [Chloroflexota bacterium]
MSAQAYLTGNSAGMRLIALLTLYNRGDFDRLRAYIADNYAPAALAEQDADARTADLRDRFEQWGKLRIEQVLGIAEHQVIALVQAQEGGGYHALQVAVEEDFPHRLTLVAWGEVETDAEEPPS